MLIKLFKSLPNTGSTSKLGIAFSGGVDSVVMRHFLSQSQYRASNLQFHFIDHGTEDSNNARIFIVNNYKDTIIHTIDPFDKKISVGQSKEEYWRNERYKIFNNLPYEIITCHHLDDQIETYLFGCMHGRGKLIPYQNKNVIRPLLLTPKQNIIKYANKHNLKWYEDKSNKDLAYARNRIRHNIVPEVLKINPGIYKTVSKLFLSSPS